MKDTNHLYNICLKNADGNIVNLRKDLKRISNKADRFIQSDKVWNRKQLITSLESIVARKGKFVCLLAGKNTGKSLVLKDIQKRFPASVYVVNLRIHPDILGGLLWTLRD